MSKSSKTWREEISDSLFVHMPLPLHPEKSLEASFTGKKVGYSKGIWNSQEKNYLPQEDMHGKVAVINEEGEERLRLTGALHADQWPEGSSPDGQYANYGTAMLKFGVAEENWEGFNRLRFWVKPDVAGSRILHVHAAVVNEGEVPVPDRYDREGTTIFDLKNHQWNECFWEFTSMGRDKVTELLLYVFLSGKDIGGDDMLSYDFKDICLERVDEPELEKGWECQKNKIALSTLGYFPDGKKTAIVGSEPGNVALTEPESVAVTESGNVAVTEPESFAVMDAESGRKVWEDKVQRIENEKGRFRVLDFTALTEPGRYYIEVGGLKSAEFRIDGELLEEAVWKTVNFLFCERCGTPVPHKHSSCHSDTMAEHNGVKLSFAGGWHDAGDLSQQAAQTGEIVHALLETAERIKDREKALYRRLLEEAQWGLDFVMKTRFGDGYRATSASSLRFTDGLIGNGDDILVMVHDHSYENFLFAGIEAYAAHVWRKEDRDYAFSALKTAREDFAFATDKFKQTGVEPSNIYEHTYGSGRSQYYAVIVWAASNLYLASGEAVYANKAAEYAGKLLACQETGEAGLPFEGFFYRDETQKAIVHYNHQSREHQFMQALELLCRTQPEHDDFPRWEVAMKRYGGYLKYLIPYPAPYGMLPAGVYRMDEPEDRETFRVMNISVDYDEEKENYREQLKAGKAVDERHVIRNFPVWFSFRGNLAVTLSMGKAASVAGHYFHDIELIEAGREQFYWLYGKNPFAQSLQYGVGSRYGAQYAELLGECTGELPVGIETYENEDVPYWPQNNNATYKEVWTSPAGRFLWLAADYL